MKKCNHLSRPQNLAVPRRQDCPAATYLCQKVRSGTPETEAVWGTRRATFYGPDRKGKSPTVNTPEALPAILGGGARAFRSIPIAACSDWGLTAPPESDYSPQQDLETERKKDRSDLVLFLFAIQRASYFAGHGCQQNPPHYRIRDIIVSKPSPNFLAVDQFKTCS